ncbi:MAG: bifunctional fucokinase/fucose-1-phosphate guanylyltransferase [Phocaeicola sp.]|uniref:bifunctional fucokinase/fucose-1-phosphate guanylyltransferase n=1 Tax=Phocaeicola sp. TaxID=2773926 RepID=UPI003F9F4900
MKKLLSIPPNLVDCFYDIEHVDPKEWFCTSDPVGCKLGSGGGTTWLLEACQRHWAPSEEFVSWLGSEKRILLHAGGQSRRLPGYAPSGKILTPIPVFRWARGQRLTQNLLSLQLPLYEQIMEKAPVSLHTLIASGDVYIRAEQNLQLIPEADVVCYGLWVNPNLAKNHGVFLSSRKNPDVLDFMLQKPSVEELGKLSQTHLFLMDIGIWLLSDKAVELLIKHSKRGDKISYYDMYSEFGLALGAHPRIQDEELNQLSVSILPLPGGEFYHYGTSRELIASTVAIQNLVNDQTKIMHHKVKPHPAMFTQNARILKKLEGENSELWVENSWIGAHWTLHHQHIITGIPQNNWTLNLPAGVCVDVVPMGNDAYVARPYGFMDKFKGAVDNPDTMFLGNPFVEWANVRNVDIKSVEGKEDLQSARIFPEVTDIEQLGIVMRWMVSEPELSEGAGIWKNSKKLSADEISSFANLRRLVKQREVFRDDNWPLLAENYEHSVFYQVNLEEAAQVFANKKMALPAALPEFAPLMTKISDSMFRARVNQLEGLPYKTDEERAFSIMREGLTESVLQKKQHPKLSVYADQIVWGRSPVRIDLAGGWTDTPPYCLAEGGSVVNIAIELNGQQPLQVYVKPGKENKIILRSIDLGAVEVVNTYEELYDFKHVGSPFSIPKVALALAGFYPVFSMESYNTLEEQLKAFGGGFEVTLFSAIPAGSGLGTSSILASTVLGAISDFCGLNWDKNEICNRTLVLEQLLTTGGGWQDQYGGVLRGVKLLETTQGMDQNPQVRWLPDYLFTVPEYQACQLLYYTGITRTAKGILAEIVRNMFLNSTEHLDLLAKMKHHAMDLYEAVQRENFDEMGRLVGKTWEQNKKLDSGTNPPQVEELIAKIKDYCLGYKLPGAGGGGFLYMIAKDAEAAARIHQILTKERINDKARFVKMALSDKGFQVSRS